MRFHVALPLSIALILSAGSGHAEQNGHAHSAEMMHGQADLSQRPQEPGQGAFAAISEIVAILSRDPGTDWGTVDIDALRAHLRDMDLLVTQANVTSRPVADGLEMTIETTGDAGSAAARMVPAHAPVLASETAWSSTIEPQETSLIWTVTSAGNQDKIRALGFYGLMATGDHHREHHLSIAKGDLHH